MNPGVGDAHFVAVQGDLQRALGIDEVVAVFGQCGIRVDFHAATAVELFLAHFGGVGLDVGIEAHIGYGAGGQQGSGDGNAGFCEKFHVVFLWLGEIKGACAEWDRCSETWCLIQPALFQHKCKRLHFGKNPCFLVSGKQK